MPNTDQDARARLPDTSEIRNAARGLGVSIAVGFLSGRQHAATDHRKNRNQKELNPLKSLEVADLARALHNGTANIPPRPFLEQGIESKEDEIYEVLGKQVDKALKGEPPNWEKVGTMAVGAVNEFVRGDYYKTNVPNAAQTIKYKGSDTPLIDGADLINSLTFVVEESE